MANAERSTVDVVNELDNLVAAVQELFLIEQPTESIRVVISNRLDVVIPEVLALLNPAFQEAIRHG